MTKYQLAKTSGIHLKIIERAIISAREKCPSLISKKGKGTKVKEVDYTLEECLYIMSALPWFNPMMNRWIKEAYIENNDTGYVSKKNQKPLLNRDAKNFLWMYNHAKSKPRVCSTCVFCVARAVNKVGEALRPYCSFYEFFFHKRKVKINIYHDRCPTYQLSKTEALIFTAVGPCYADKVGKFQNTTLGLDNSEFISKRQKGEPIVLLNEF